MFLSVLLVAAGLAVALIGMVMTFITNPPIYGSGSDAGTWGPPEEEARKEKVERHKVVWSKSGVWLLVVGTFLQLIGTVWQVVKLACR